MSLVIDEPSLLTARADSGRVQSCLHCGTPLDDGQQDFCCAGCSCVHSLIQQNGLDRYYRLRPGMIAPVSPSATTAVDFSWLKTRQQSAEAPSGPDLAELSCQLQGLSCVACVWLVDQIYQRQPGAIRVEVDAPRGRVRLVWKPGLMDLAAFATELHRFGYQLGPTEGNPLPNSRALTGRLGVGGFLALNNMLFTLPGYLGLARTSEWTDLFTVITAACATLSMVIGGGYFMGRAWRGARMGVLDLDLPIALGVTGAYLGSLAGWLLGRPELVYFDFVSLFIFLMLVGRWTQEAAIERNRHQLLRMNPVPDAVRSATNPGTNLEVSALAPGDRFLVGPGQLVPVAARILKNAGLFNLAWISGEPEPRHIPAGRLAPAGAVNAGNVDLELQAEEGWAESLLARLLRACTEGAPRPTGLERSMKIYFACVSSLVLVSGWYWIEVGQPVTAARAILSLLVVSCPCVLGLSLPMATEFAVTRLRRTGVFIRDPHLWNRLKRIRTIVFDKTGTLTFAYPALQNPEALAALSPRQRQILLRMAESSLHPFSRGLRESMLRHTDPPASPCASVQVDEIPGQGLSVKVGNDYWSLGRRGWRSEGPEAADSRPTESTLYAPSVEFRHNGRRLATFLFQESIRPGVAGELAKLSQQGYAIHILSGDRNEHVTALANKLGLAPNHANGGMTPDDKAAWITAHNPEHILMLGDGANDALAFSCAAVRGTPVADRTTLSQAADFFLTGQSLDGVRQLLAVGQLRRRAARAAIGFATVYNLTVAVLCVAGKMNPLLAAILMPSSSLLSLLLVSSLSRPWGTNKTETNRRMINDAPPEPTA